MHTCPNFVGPDDQNKPQDTHENEKYTEHWIYKQPGGSKTRRSLPPYSFFDFISD